MQCFTMPAVRSSAGACLGLICASGCGSPSEEELEQVSAIESPIIGGNQPTTNPAGVVPIQAGNQLRDHVRSDSKYAGRCARPPARAGHDRLVSGRSVDDLQRECRNPRGRGSATRYRDARDGSRSGPASFADQQSRSVIHRDDVPGSRLQPCAPDRGRSCRRQCSAQRVQRRAGVLRQRSGCKLVEYG
jgi:hypothetical protein